MAIVAHLMQGVDSNDDIERSGKSVSATPRLLKIISVLEKHGPHGAY